MYKDSVLIFCFCVYRAYSREWFTALSAACVTNNFCKIACRANHVQMHKHSEIWNRNTLRLATGCFAKFRNCPLRKGRVNPVRDRFLLRARSRSKRSVGYDTTYVWALLRWIQAIKVLTKLKKAIEKPTWTVRQPTKPLKTYCDNEPHGAACLTHRLAYFHRLGRIRDHG